MKRISLGIFLCLLAFIFAGKANAKVKLGIDVAMTQPYKNKLLHKRLALVANSASRNSEGKNTIDVLFKDPQINLVKLFSPEHGLRHFKDTAVEDKHDNITGLPVFSLYGPRKIPTAAELKSVDAVVIDLQDVGSRYYTYATTMALILQQAKRLNKEVIILDRPNPLGGAIVAGALLDTKQQHKFDSYFSIPMRHGLTFGELARYFNQQFHIGVKLTVIPMQHWQRKMLFPDTGLAWYAPSPALPTFQQAFLYNILGPLESLRLSVGRSLMNQKAFMIYGAPWITPQQAGHLVSKLNQLQLPGLQFKMIAWIPNRRIYKDKKCFGFLVKLTQINQVNCFYSSLAVLRVLYQQFGNTIAIEQATNMLGTHALVDSIKSQQPISQIIKNIRRKDQQYLAKRKTALLYH